MARMQRFRVEVDYQDADGAMLNDAETVYAPSAIQARAQVRREYERAGFRVLVAVVEDVPANKAMASYLSEFEYDEDEDDE